jgi:endogenous inhibitor of DNA gyrase (YacG/DUF329 family)
MAEASGAQRAYRAPCPGCGAPVEFRSAQSAFAVCAYCRSTVARQGEQLARIGRMAELFEDFSPLQLFATGRVLDQPFTIVGRLQYSYAGGRWTEWIAALGEGERTGILSEDNGAFVFSLPLALKQPAPPAKHLRVGASTAIDGQRYAIASSEQASLVSAQGELPKLPELGRPFTVVELRNDRGEVLSLEYAGDEPTASLGRSVQLKDLQLAGLRDESARSEQGRSFGCPRCGAPVTVNFDQSRSIACGNCHSLIDLTQGIGGELRHAEQDEPVRPLIALGALGTLQGVAWQVVGFQHRMGTEPGDDERFGWSEYLLFNRERGFAFLVDAEDGWSLVRPTTGAPTLAGGQATQATYLGKTYEQQYAYHAETTYAAGEFYWKVERGQRTFNRDFAAGGSLLSMERSAHEVTWSAGTRIESATVAAAFKLEAKKEMFKRSDAAPLSAASGLGCGTIVLIVVVVVIVLILLSTCSGSSGGGSRSSGGSYGGYSSGGGHK